jgi:D-alanine-D-alanine ligase
MGRASSEDLPDVLLLFGGPGGERLVSVASAQNVGRLLPEAALWFWAPAGSVHRVSRAALLEHQRPFEVELQPDAPAFAPSLPAALDSLESRDSVFFLALHGDSGEDGTVQDWLESRGLGFTGSSAEACRKAMDKLHAKALVQAQGVRVPAGERLAGDLARVRQQLQALRERLGELVLKPLAEGSSTGLLFVETEEDLERAAAAAASQPERAYFAEACVKGVELTVGVLDDGNGLRELPCSEVRLAAGGRFDYEGKYLGRGTTEITPAEVPEPIAQAAQEVAKQAHRTLGCLGYSRTDLIVNSEGPVFLELNTLPGLTRASFIPQQLEAAGIPLADFLATQIALGRRRYR